MSGDTKCYLNGITYVLLDKVDTITLYYSCYRKRAVSFLPVHEDSRKDVLIEH